MNIDASMSKRPDGYEQVGQSVAIMQPTLSIQDARTVRHFVATTFFDGIKVFTPLVNEDEDKSVGGVGLHTPVHGPGIEDTPSIFVGASLYHVSDNSWRLAALRTRMRRSAENLRPQRVWSKYSFSVVGDQLLEATKEVRVVRAIGTLSVEAALEEGLEPHIARKAYERQITLEDCHRLMNTMTQAVKRRQATGR